MSNKKGKTLMEVLEPHFGDDDGTLPCLENLDKPFELDRGDACNLKPVGQHVLILRDAQKENILPSGIILPPEKEDKTDIRFGTVVRIGNGRKLANGKVVPMTVKPGDRVVFMETPFTKLGRAHRIDGIRVDGGRYDLVREIDVIGIIESE
jgi:chaperonin GroES